MKKSNSKRTSAIGSFYKKVQTPVRIVKKRPIISFVLSLLLLFILIFVGNTLRKPEATIISVPKEKKEVEMYRIGTSPAVSVQGKVEKTGVTTIYAQSAGVVQVVNLTEGSAVGRGQSIVSLSTNYAGGNIPSLQRSIAQTNYQFTKETNDIQKEIIQKNREIAQKTDENADELRAITEDSIARTNEVITTSQNSLDIIDQLISFYEGITTPTLTDASSDENVILALKQQKASLLNGLSAADQAVKNADYSSSDENAPAQISNITKDVTLKQLELQEKTLALNLEIAELNLKVAQVTESLMFPSSPFAGTIERIFVNVGDLVSQGQPIATVVSGNQEFSVLVRVPKEIKDNMTLLEPSIIHLGDTQLELFPMYIPTEPTDGRLYGVRFAFNFSGDFSTQTKGSILESYNTLLSSVGDGEYVRVEIPVGYPDSASAIPFVPIDSVFQSQDKNILFVNKNGVAEALDVELGSIFGRFVEIRSSLNGYNEIILDRTVIEGDRIEEI